MVCERGTPVVLEWSRCHGGFQGGGIEAVVRAMGRQGRVGQCRSMGAMC